MPVLYDARVLSVSYRHGCWHVFLFQCCRVAIDSAGIESSKYELERIQVRLWLQGVATEVLCVYDVRTCASVGCVSLLATRHGSKASLFNLYHSFADGQLPVIPERSSWISHLNYVRPPMQAHLALMCQVTLKPDHELLTACLLFRLVPHIVGADVVDDELPKPTWNGIEVLWTQRTQHQHHNNAGAVHPMDITHSSISNGRSARNPAIKRPHPGNAFQHSDDDASTGGGGSGDGGPLADGALPSFLPHSIPVLADVKRRNFGQCKHMVFDVS